MKNRVSRKLLTWLMSVVMIAGECGRFAIPVQAQEEENIEVAQYDNVYTDISEPVKVKKSKKAAEEESVTPADDGIDTIVFAEDACANGDEGDLEGNFLTDNNLPQFNVTYLPGYYCVSVSGNSQYSRNPSGYDRNYYVVYAKESDNMDFYPDVTTTDDFSERYTIEQLSGYTDTSLDQWISYYDIQLGYFAPNETYIFRIVTDNYDSSQNFINYSFVTKPRKIRVKEALAEGQSALRIKKPDLENPDTWYKYGYNRVNFVVEIDNPKNEYVSSYNIVAKAGESALNIDRTFGLGYHKGKITNQFVLLLDPDKGLEQNVQVGISAYYGDEANTTEAVYCDAVAVNLMNKEDITDLDITVNPENGVDTAIAASGIILPVYDADATRLAVYFRKKAAQGEEPADFERADTLIDTNNGKATVRTRELDSETTYEYYCAIYEENGAAYLEKGTKDAPYTFTTGKYEEKILTEADFVDKALFTYLSEQYPEGINSSTLRGLSEFILPFDHYYGISSLEDIALYMPGLVNLNMVGEDISDIEPLLQMKYLRYVYLPDNEIEKLPDLTGCKWDSLWLSGNLISYYAQMEANIPAGLDIGSQDYRGINTLDQMIIDGSGKYPLVAQYYHGKAHKNPKIEVTLDGTGRKITALAGDNLHSQYLAITDLKEYFPGLTPGRHLVGITVFNALGKPVAENYDYVEWIASDTYITTNGTFTRGMYYGNSQEENVFSIPVYAVGEHDAINISVTRVDDEETSFVLTVRTRNAYGELINPNDNVFNWQYYDAAGTAYRINSQNVARYNADLIYNNEGKLREKPVMPEGDYNVVINGTVKRGVIHCRNYSTVEGSTTGHLEGVDNSGEYLYVYVSGNIRKPEKLIPVIRYNGTDYTEYISVNYDYFERAWLYKLKKKSNWNEIESAPDDREYMIDLVNETGEPVQDYRAIEYIDNVHCRGDIVTAKQLKFTAVADILADHFNNRKKTFEIYLTGNSEADQEFTMSLYDETGAVLLASGTAKAVGRHLSFTLKDKNGDLFLPVFHDDPEDPEKIRYVYNLKNDSKAYMSRNISYTADDAYEGVFPKEENAQEDADEEDYTDLGIEWFDQILISGESVIRLSITNDGNIDPGRITASIYELDEDGEPANVLISKELVKDENGLYTSGEWAELAALPVGRYGLYVYPETEEYYEDNNWRKFVVIEDEFYLAGGNADFACKDGKSCDPTSAKVTMYVPAFSDVYYAGDKAAEILAGKNITIEVREEMKLYSDDDPVITDAQVKVAYVENGRIILYINGLDPNSEAIYVNVLHNGNVLNDYSFYHYNSYYYGPYDDEDEEEDEGLTVFGRQFTRADEEGEVCLEYVKDDEGKSACFYVSPFGKHAPYRVDIYAMNDRLNPVLSITDITMDKATPYREYDLLEAVKSIKDYEDTVFRVVIVPSDNTGIYGNLFTGFLTAKDAISDINEVPVQKHQPEPEPEQTNTQTTTETTVPGEPVIPVAEPGKHLLMFYVKSELYEYIQVEDGKVAPALSKGDPEGNFLGWYVNNKNLWDPTEPVTVDLKLDARFAASSPSENKLGESALDSQVEVVNGQTLWLVKGQSFEPEDADWKTDNKSVLTIKNGKIKAKADGKAKLYNDKISVEVNVTTPVMKKKSMTIYVGAKEEEIKFDYDKVNYNVYWTSQKKDVVKVSADGKVYGIAKGSSTITAYINGKSYTCKVTVKEADVSKKDWTKQVDLVPFQKSTIKISGFSLKGAEWTSDMNPADVSSEKKVMLKDDVVSISNKGVVTAIGAGCTHVKVKKDNVEKILTISVNQPSVSVVHMNTGSSGKKISIYGLKKAIAWKPDDATVVSVDSKGKIKPLKAGHTTLRYTEGTFNYVVEMYVEEIKFTGVQLYGENAILSGSGSKYSLTMKPDSAIMLKADGIFQNVLFTSGKDSVVFADEAGVITARSSGKTKLTATVNGKKITINVEVKKQ